MDVSQAITVQDLDDRLLRLAPGERLNLANGDFTRLFGVNDAAQGRLVNFAKLHGCVAFKTGAGITFCRQPQSAPRSDKR